MGTDVVQPQKASPSRTARWAWVAVIATPIGLALGVVLTYGLNSLLARLTEVPTVGGGYLVVTMAVMWLVGLLAALAPALRGSMVSPVVATRTA